MPYIGNQHNVGDHVNNFKVLDDISSHTATFDGSATSVVDTTNNTIRVPLHRFIQGQRVTYTNGGGGNIGGLTSGTAYYVSFDSPNTIRLATSLANANSNTVINLSSVGSGTSHTLNAAFDGINTKFKVTYASGKAARFNNATQLNVAINNVIQRPNLSAASFTEGFAIEDSHKIVFKDAPTVNDIFWGSIIANTIENFDLRDNEVNNFTGNGSTTEFTLSSIPANNESVIVTIDGVLQHPSDSTTARAYTLIDSIIQFTAAPALNAEIQVRHIGFAGASTNDVSGFYGRTGNVALTANDHITTGDLTSRNVNVSGILTASSASFGGNVSIGGTLTYEDVTNIDSVGLITARNGIFVSAGSSVGIGTDDLTYPLEIHDSDPRIQLVDTDLTSNRSVQLRNSAGSFVPSASQHAIFYTGGSERVRIKSNGNVGIGTSPDEKLHVVITSATATAAKFERSHNNNVAIEYKNTTSRMYAGLAGDAIGWAVDDDANLGVQPMFMVRRDSGNIGIGTNNPGSILDVRQENDGGQTKIMLYNTDNDNTTTQTAGLFMSPDSRAFAYAGLSVKKEVADMSSNAGRDVSLVLNVTENNAQVEAVHIASSGNVGIGTDSPEEVLHIQSGSPVIKFSDGALDSYIKGDASDLQFIVGGTSRDFKFQSSINPTSEVARITGDGKVGIGTNNPEAPLVVRSSENTLGILTSTDDGANLDLFDNDTQSRIRTVDGRLHLYSDFGSSVADSSIRFFVDGDNEKVRITHDGNVGIGSENPSKTLSVVSGSNLAVSIINDTTFATAGIYLEGGRNAGTGIVGELQFYNRRNSGVTSKLLVNGDGDFNFDGSNTNSKVGINSISPEKQLVVRTGSGGDGGILVKPNVNYANNQDRAYLIVGTDGFGLGGNNWNNYGFQHRIKSNSSGTSRVTIDTSSGEAFCVENTGNVGIGTNDPVRPLHIHAADCRIRLEDAGVATDVELQNSSGDAVLTTNGASNLRLQTDNTERLRIKSDGKVGIGTNNPQALLHLQGEGGGNTSGLYFKNGPHDIVRQYFANGNDNSDFVITYDGTGGAEITLEQTGNVALNESNNGNVYIGSNASLDNARLTIAKSAVGFTTAIALHNSMSGGIGSKIISTRALVLGADYENNSGDNSSYMAFETNASEKVRIASDGNFGIGTDNPLGKLHLSSGTSGDCVLIIESDTDNDNEGDNGRIEFKQDGGSSQSAIGTDNNELVLSNSVSSNGGIVFKTGTTSGYTNATEQLRIHSNGNVMIGSGTPSTQLHVQNSSSVVRVESTSTSTSARVEITGASNSYSGLHFGDTSDVDNGYIRYYNADNYFIIGAAAAERVRIYSDGRVNIGGTNEVQLESGSEAILYLHGAIVGANVDYAYGQRIILDDDDDGTTTADRERGSIYAQFNGNCSGGNTTDETRAWNIYSDLNINADYDNGYGVYADVRANFTSGTITTLRGVYGICQTQNSGQITEMIGAYGLSQTTTGANSVTINDLVGVKGRANMCAGNSTANVIDLVGVWGEIDNDNNTAQATGGKCALFYGGYNKTTGLHNPQGIRIDTDVPNYFRGDIAIDGGGNFLPTGNHKIHIRNGTNATGIFLEQTGDQYNVIKGSANRSGSDNAIIDIQGYWDTTQVGRIRIDTGADTTNKDDGRIQFFTASGGNLSEVMQIQENGEIAMDSSGSPSDALANLHVQNETFRVSNHSQTGSYIHLRAWESGDDGDRATIMQMANNVPKFNVTRQGQVFGASTHYAGRARTDANSPTNYYAHGAHGFYAYSARTDDTSAYRTYVYIRAWDQGDHGDRSIIQYADSGSDSDSVNSTSDIRFVVKADGRVQGKGGSFFAGRVEHDASSPSDYFQNGERGFQAYGNDATDETYILARNVADNSNIFFSEVNGEANAKIQADGDAFTDGTWSDANADYAEMFEWSDGNTSNEERRGMTVVLDGDKIRLATDSDNKDNIIGVVSVNPVVLGDSAPLGWHGRYKKDVFGSPVKKAHEFLVWNRGYREVDGVSVLFKQPDPDDPRSYSKCERCPVEEIDERKAKGEIPDYAIENNIRITTYAKEIDTETYDSTKKYIPRQQRKEWDAIGLVGKLIVKRGQPIGSRWILMKSNIGTDPNDSSIILDKYLVR